MCGLSVLAVQLHQRPFLPTGLDCREGYWTTPGYANSRIANSRTGRLASWTSRGCHRRLCVLSFRSFGGICETATPPVVQSATSPVRELTSPRVGVSASCPVTVVNVFWTISVRRLRGGRESGTHFPVCVGMFISRKRRPSCVFPDTYTCR